MVNERFFGSYRRQLTLGEGIDSDRISATYENGVLTVTILPPRRPSRARSKSRTAANRRASRPPRSTLDKPRSNGSRR